MYNYILGCRKTPLPAISVCMCILEVVGKPLQLPVMPSSVHQFLPAKTAMEHYHFSYTVLTLYMCGVHVSHVPCTFLLMLTLQIFKEKVAESLKLQANQMTVC